MFSAAGKANHMYIGLSSPVQSKASNKEALPFQHNLYYLCTVSTYQLHGTLRLSSVVSVIQQDADDWQTFHSNTADELSFRTHLIAVALPKCDYMQIVYILVTSSYLVVYKEQPSKGFSTELALQALLSLRTL